MSLVWFVSIGFGVWIPCWLRFIGPWIREGRGWICLGCGIGPTCGLGSMGKFSEGWVIGVNMGECEVVSGAVGDIGVAG